MRIKEGSLLESVWGFGRVAIGLLPLVFIFLNFSFRHVFSYLFLGAISFLFIRAKLKKIADTKFSVRALIFMLLVWPVGLLLRNELYRSKKRTAFVDQISKAIDKNIELDNQIEKMCEGGTDQDVIPWGIGEFGLEVTNPIPIKGRSGRMSYMEKIRPLNSSEFAWEEELPSSVRAPNIEHPIDKYVISIEDKNFVPIYMSIYHKKTSDKAPKGFKLVAVKGRRGSCVRWVDS